MIRIAICDDQKSFTEIIRNHVASWVLRKRMDNEICVFYSGEELLQSFEAKLRERERFDLVLLDMKMGELNGIQTAKRIRALDPRAYIIFVTSHFTEVVFDAFEVRAFRYIMKSKMNEVLPKALDDVINDMESDREKSIYVTFNKTHMRIVLADVLYFETSTRLVTAHMVYGEDCRFTMSTGEMAAVLEGKGFTRCHQSFFVNCKYIRSIRNYIVYLSDGTELPASRMRYEQAKKEFAWSMR